MKTINKGFNSTLKVLLVDDNYDMAFVTGTLLGLIGFQIRTCNSGTDCVMLAQSTSPDVILLDIDMPGMNGFQVCKHIRSQTWGRNYTIIAFSGRDLCSGNVKSDMLGFDSYLAKPVDVEELSHAIVDTYQKKQLGIR